jgi:multiple sugar transport system permease protein
VLKRVKVRPAAIAYHLAGLACAAIFVLPFFWAFVASLRQPGLPPARTVEWWPQPAHWDNYAELFRVVPMGRYALNSLIVVAVAMPVTLLTAALAGFALSQLDAAWRRRLVMASVALMLIPGMAVWTFRFHILDWLGLVDTLWALIVPAVAGGSPLFVLLFYWACWRIPSELYESARLDGAEAWTVWWRIARPLVRPTTAAVVVLAFALYWGDFTTPVLYIFRPELYTLPIGLQLLRQMDSTNMPLLMAGSTLMAAPVVVVFLAVQRLFLSDLSLGRVVDQ